MEENTIGVPKGTGLVRESEINRVVSKLHQAVEYASKNFDELTKMVSPVLRSEPDDVTEKSVEPEFNTKLAQDINAAIKKVDYLIARIGDVKNRIEL